MKTIPIVIGWTRRKSEAEHWALAIRVRGNGAKVEKHPDGMYSVTYLYPSKEAQP